jgi:uncharacterized membrane protein YphA (DoxX/SURF4 family)
MNSDSQPAPAPKWMFWTGWIATALPSLVLLMSGGMKLLKPEPIVEGFGKIGWNPDDALALGIVEVACTILYLFPRTAVLGAILLTGYLGGAIATHARLHEPIIPQIVFGVLVWGGLYFRDARLRALLPLRN